MYLDSLKDYLEQKLSKVAANISTCKDAIAHDFNGSLPTYCKNLFQSNIQYSYLKRIQVAIDGIEIVKFLQSEADHWHQKLLLNRPYREGTNPMYNLMHAWEFEMWQYFYQELNKMVNIYEKKEYKD